MYNMSQLKSDMLNIFGNGTRLNGSKTTKQWASRNGHVLLYERFISTTDFLNTDVKFGQRWFHVKNGMDYIPVCCVCDNTCEYDTNNVIYRKTCGDPSCVKQYRSIINRGDRNPMYGKHHTSDQIAKRIESRHNNGMSWHSESSKSKIQKSNKRVHNDPEYRKNDTEMRIAMGVYTKQSITMKNKILMGEFTPCVTNSWANSRCKLIINGYDVKYRSTWDAVFQILNPSCEYETLRIKYISPKDNKTHSYIVDFVDNVNRITYEIKPKSNRSNDVVLAKEQYLIQWCHYHGYTYSIIDDDWFSKNAHQVDYDLYDDKIRKGMGQFI